MPKQPRFLLDAPLTAPGIYALNRQESHHAADVLRLGMDDGVVVFDGAGNYAEAVIAEVDKKAVSVRVDEVRSEPHLPLVLSIATAIPKGKRWQALVEKCTELGVDRIIPLLAGRSVVKGEGDADKWRRWVVEAAKQSRRARVPEVTEPMPFPQALSQAKKDNALLLMADPGGESPVAYRDLFRHVLHVMVMIGPEGGFTDEESATLRKLGAKPMRLSPFILRIETAAATVCALIREVLM